MNCINHAERTATAFCQNCGKPLCAECTRSADNLILCEPCFVARITERAKAGGAASSASQAWAQASASAGPPPPGYRPPPYIPVAGAVPYPAYRGNEPKPVIAGLLGFIPGVGAMYNGQFVKALLHVVIFIVLIGVTQHFDLAGLLIPAWIFYQVFDAAQTASARRDGRPLPDPFGLLDMSQRLGSQAVQQGPLSPQRPQPPPYQPQQSGSMPPYGTPGSAVPYGASGGASWPSGVAAAAAPGVDPAAAANAGFGAVPVAGFSASPVAASAAMQAYPAQYVRTERGEWAAVPGATPGTGAMPGVSPVYPVMPAPRGEPVGAIVLIVVGLLFLLSTLGVLNVDWITRGWPVLLLLLGAWLLVRRARAASALAAPSVYPPSPHASSAAPPVPPPASAAERDPGRNPLSITPQPAGSVRPAGEASETGTWPHEEDKQ